MCASWCGVFLATNGVKQGGVLSPVLFCVYIDGLLVALSRSNVGFYIGRSYIGVLAYADDLVITAPSPALGKMSTTCDNYATEFYMSFNASKSNCVVMIPRSQQCLIPLLR